MANYAALYGFQPVRSIHGGPGYVRRFCGLANYATAIGIGDPVTGQGTSGVPTDYGSGLTVDDVQAASSAGVIDGVALNYRAASTLATVWAQTDPNMLFAGVVNGAALAFALATSDTNANFATGSPSTTTGYSTYAIDGASENTTNTLDLKVWDYLPYTGDSASLANPRYMVRFNKHRQVNQLAGL